MFEYRTLVIGSTNCDITDKQIGEKRARNDVTLSTLKSIHSNEIQTFQY